MKSAMRDKREERSTWILPGNFILSREKRQNECCSMRMESCMRRHHSEKQQ